MLMNQVRCDVQCAQKTHNTHKTSSSHTTRGFDPHIEAPSPRCAQLHSGKRIAKVPSSSCIFCFNAFNTCILYYVSQICIEPFLQALFLFCEQPSTQRAGQPSLLYSIYLLSQSLPDPAVAFRLERHV